jgi:hypothetical protein
MALENQIPAEKMGSKVEVQNKGLTLIQDAAGLEQTLKEI